MISAHAEVNVKTLPPLIALTDDDPPDIGQYYVDSDGRLSIILAEPFPTTQRFKEMAGLDMELNRRIKRLVHLPRSVVTAYEVALIKKRLAEMDDRLSMLEGLGRPI